MQRSHSALNPEKSREALSKLRAAAEFEAETSQSNMVFSTDGKIDFDIEQAKISQPNGDPNDQVGSALYSGQNSPHIGNGHGAPQ
jgi:hypothetical protein